eukprot:TRINITY_DN4759_c0_g1_i6.p1 TRINITY_DN4759_c0_g1~~TRINITY_DN4759_c0_g1_i6.p1  ORF type:complete len:377 (+),score=18.39 TRINITY_DN4759_c0_g1_i6:120-1250(+)
MSSEGDNEKCIDGKVPHNSLTKKRQECALQIGLLVLLPFLFLGMAVWLLLILLWNPFQFFNRKSRQSYQSPSIPDGLKQEYIKVNDVKLHVVHGGVEDAPLMVFLHGVPEFWFSWRHQLREFKKRYRVAAIDMRGFNLSDKPENLKDYMLDKLASDVMQVVQHLGHENCILVGHDWGAIVAQATAAFYPKIVSKMVLLGSLNLRLFIENKTAGSLLRLFYTLVFRLPWFPQLWLSSRNFDIVRQLLLPMRQYGPKYPHANSIEEVEYYVYAAAVPGAVTGMINYYRALQYQYMIYAISFGANSLMPGYEKLFDSIAVPTQIIHGQDDHPIALILWNNFESVFTDGELHVIPHCSHWVQIDRPDEVNKLINQFLLGK